jgi:hypothetical protein
VPCFSWRSRKLGSSPLVAPAEDERVDVALQLAAYVEEAGAFRCAQPLVLVQGARKGGRRASYGAQRDAPIAGAPRLVKWSQT